MMKSKLINKTIALVLAVVMAFPAVPVNAEELTESEAVVIETDVYRLWMRVLFRRRFL